MDRFNEELTALLAHYRNSLPDPEASAEFMPRLWSKIEARRSFTFRIKRLTQVFVAGAFAMCLAMSCVLILPTNQRQEAGTYLDVLADAQPSESLAALGIVGDSAEINQ